MSTPDWLKRGTPAKFPHEFSFIVNPKDPSYDERVDDPIAHSAVMDAAANGIGQSVLIRPFSAGAQAADTLAVLIDGQQRVKRGLVVNALAGVQAYDGPLQSVHAAISHAIEVGAVSLIMKLCPNGLKIPYKVERGTVRDAYAMKIALNEHRSGGSGDSPERKALKAQRMEKLGASAAEIATAFGISDKEAKELLAMQVGQEQPAGASAENMTTPVARTKAPRKVRPSPKFIQTFFADRTAQLTEREKQIVAYILGDADLVSLSDLFEAKETVEPLKAAEHNFTPDVPQDAVQPSDRAA